MYAKPLEGLFNGMICTTLYIWMTLSYNIMSFSNQRIMLKKAKHLVLSKIVLLTFEGWMHQNRLKLNFGKSEVLILFISKRNKKLLTILTFQLGSHRLYQRHMLRILASILIQQWAWRNRWTACVITGNAQLCNIEHIMCCLAYNATKSLDHIHWLGRDWIIVLTPYSVVFLKRTWTKCSTAKILLHGT